MTNKDNAKNFLELASKGESRKAFQLYVGKNFLHHNAYFKGDGNSLMIAMEESSKTNPNKIFEIQRALEDGEFVAVHSRLIQSPNNIELAVIHIFRFENEKIIELWDFGQAVPSEMKNENGMF
jgi:predicted SnoaL-like aldol condensation-catalyzing enzyme